MGASRVARARGRACGTTRGGASARRPARAASGRSEIARPRGKVARTSLAIRETERQRLRTEPLPTYLSGLDAGARMALVELDCAAVRAPEATAQSARGPVFSRP